MYGILVLVTNGCVCQISCNAGQSLHAKEVQNPYITVLSIICKTLARMDDDQMIPAYGFGDKLSRDTGLFSFAAGDQPLHKLEGVLQVHPQF